MMDAAHCDIDTHRTQVLSGFQLEQLVRLVKLQCEISSRHGESITQILESLCNLNRCVGTLADATMKLAEIVAEMEK